jgi:Protein of unknown function (DUF2442)
MTDLPRITDAMPLHDRWIRLRFSDGVVQEVDLAPVLADGQLSAAIRDDDAVFAQVRVNKDSGTVEWPGEIDLDPDVLYGTFEPEVGGPLERRVIQAQP